jgi:hypothetical protein
MTDEGSIVGDAENPSSETDKELAARLAKASEEAAKLDQAIKKLQGEKMDNAQYEDTAKWFSEAEKSAKGFQENLQKATAQRGEYQDFFSKQLLDYRNRSVSGGPMAEEVKEGLRAADESVKVIIKDLKEMDSLLDKAGDDFIKNKEYWNKQLQEYRDKSATGGPAADEVKAGEKAGDAEAKQVIKKYDALQKANEKFIASFREGAGKVWDDFFIKGQGVFSSLANLLKGLLNTIGRTLFEDLATALLTGGRGGGATGLLSKGLGSIGIGGALMGGTATAAPQGSGFTSLLSGGLFGGLFGGGAAAAAGPAVTAMGSASVITGIGGAIDTTIAPPAMGGLTGALGLQGGAGLFGLGAATIPIIGGIAAGIFGLYELFKHHNQPPNTPDPYAQETSRTMWFNTTMPFEKLTTLMTNLDQTLKQVGGAVTQVSGSLDQLEGIPGDQLIMKNGNAVTNVVAARMSDRVFRKQMAGAILEQS